MSTITLLACILFASIQSVHTSPCSNNEIPWPKSSSSTKESVTFDCQPFDQAVREATIWLKDRMPPWDKDNEMTLFGAPDGPDGLDTGIASVGINASLHTKIDYSWTWNIPKQVFYDYILPYAIVNEARNNWRPYLHSVLVPTIASLPVDASINDVFTAVNAGTTGTTDSVWKLLGNNNNGGEIVFKSSQTPLIYDAMSTIVYGYASCTGISILAVDSLRSVGIAARLVGTPAWQGHDENGNHNWLEVYIPDVFDVPTPNTAAQRARNDNDNDNDRWYFIEGLPAGNGETLFNPCDKWFCNPTAFANPNGTTSVYAAHFDRFHSTNNQDEFVYYPMAWDRTNLDVPGVDRTQYYTEVCSKC